MAGMKDEEAQIPLEELPACRNTPHSQDHSARRRSDAAASSRSNLQRPDNTTTAGPTSRAHSSSFDSYDGPDSLNQAEVEEKNLFFFSETVLNEDGNPEPWFMEMTRFRRLYFTYLNKEMAICRKAILEKERASDEAMVQLGNLLHRQAEAIRDFQYIRSLDFLPPDEQQMRESQCVRWFPNAGTSHFDNVFPFRAENYRCLPRETGNETVSDGVREFFRTYMPVRWSWTEAEKQARSEMYRQKYNPKVLSPVLDRLASFVVAFVGALFILVPMYIMTFGNPTRNLITTTIAVVLFATLCSITLKASNEQTLGATVSYAAVLMVFVGLTSTNNTSTNNS